MENNTIEYRLIYELDGDIHDEAYNDWISFNLKLEKVCWMTIVPLCLFKK